MVLVDIAKRGFRIKKIAVCLVLMECTVVLLFLLRSSMTSSIGINLSRTVVVIRNSLSSCPTEKMKAIQNMSVHVNLNGKPTFKSDLVSKCLTINESATGLYRILHEKNFGDVTCNNTQKRFRKKWEKPVYTALASYPGSGNTWVRHLLEELTGIYTGGFYMDIGLKKVFPAERYTEGVIAIKTHEPVDKLKQFKFDRVMLLVRDPFDALLSSYNLGLTMSHTAIPRREKFSNTAFSKHVKTNLAKWSQFYLDWVRKFDGEIFVVFYDKLKTDLLNSITKMAAFLETNVTLHQLWCLQKRREGLFRRGVKPKWMDKSNIIEDNVYYNIVSVKELVYEEITRHRFYMGSLKTN